MKKVREEHVKECKADEVCRGGGSTVGRLVPAVSVVVPCYNQGAYLEETLQSVLKQDYEDFECLVVNDGSTDSETLSALKRCLAWGDPRLVVLSHPGEKNCGVSESRNLALDHARGEFIAFLDSDDVWLPTKLSRQLRAFERAPAHVGLVFCDYWSCETVDGVTPMRECPLLPNPFSSQLPVLFDGSRGESLKSFLKNPSSLFVNWIQSPTPLVRAACFRDGLRFKGPPQLTVQFEDLLMWLCLASRWDFVAIPEPLAIYRMHSSQYTHFVDRDEERSCYLRGMDQVLRGFVEECDDVLSPDTVSEIQDKFKRYVLLCVSRGGPLLMPEIIRIVSREGLWGSFVSTWIRTRYIMLKISFCRSPLWRAVRPWFRPSGYENGGS